MEAVVCGIDPGLGVTGYALVQTRDGRTAIIDAGVCRFDSNSPLSRRLVEIERNVSSILNEHRPDAVAVESLYAHYKHPRTAIMMGHARGVILLAAGKLGIEVRDYAATQVKRFLTGNGRATKGQMQRAIQTTLGLKELPEPSDLADAIAIAMCCAAEIAQSKPVGVAG